MKRMAIIITITIILTIFISVITSVLEAPIQRHITNLGSNEPSILTTTNNAHVVIVSKGTRQQENGSGFYIRSNIVVTCNHILQFSNVYVNGKSAMTIARNSSRDIALIQTATKIKDFLNLSKSGIYQGQPVITIGNPKGMINTMSSGIVSNTYRVLSNSKDPVFQFTASVSKGSSGGAVLNSRGEVIGMVKSMLDDGQDLNFAIPADQIQEELDRIDNN